MYCCQGQVQWKFFRYDKYLQIMIEKRNLNFSIYIQSFFLNITTKAKIATVNA